VSKCCSLLHLSLFHFLYSVLYFVASGTAHTQKEVNQPPISLLEDPCYCICHLIKMGCTTSRHAAVANKNTLATTNTTASGAISENCGSHNTTKEQNAEIEPSSSLTESAISDKPLDTDKEDCSTSLQQHDQEILHENQAARADCISSDSTAAMPAQTQPPLLFTKKYFTRSRSEKKKFMNTNATFLAHLQNSEPSWHGGGCDENSRKNSSFAS
jgi:hypothetical protein